MTTSNDERMQVAVDGLAEAIRILARGILQQNIGASSKQAARDALDVLNSAAARLERTDIQDQVRDAVRDAIHRESNQGGILWKLINSGQVSATVRRTSQPESQGVVRHSDGS